jgi:hypothetical protein
MSELYARETAENSKESEKGLSLLLDHGLLESLPLPLGRPIHQYTEWRPVPRSPDVDEESVTVLVSTAAGPVFPSNLASLRPQLGCVEVQG